MMRTVLLALSARPAIGRAMSRLALTRGLVRRFVAGTRLEDGLPFGEDSYGYFMRRLAERPANLLFLRRNLAR